MLRKIKSWQFFITCVWKEVIHIEREKDKRLSLRQSKRELNQCESPLTTHRETSLISRMVRCPRLRAPLTLQAEYKVWTFRQRRGNPRPSANTYRFLPDKIGCNFNTTDDIERSESHISWRLFCPPLLKYLSMYTRYFLQDTAKTTLKFYSEPTFRGALNTCESLFPW